MNAYEDDALLKTRSNVGLLKDCARRSSSKLRFKPEIKLVNYEPDKEVRKKKALSFSDPDSNSISCYDHTSIDETPYFSEPLPFIKVENNDPDDETDEDAFDDKNKGKLLDTNINFNAKKYNLIL